MNKSEAQKVLFECAELYKNNLIDYNLLFLCAGKNRKMNALEMQFSTTGFLHLTGVKFPGKKIPARAFFDKCINRRLSLAEFDLALDGTTELKLKILPMLFQKNLSASMIGDFSARTSLLVTEKLAGGIKGCMGFVRDEGTGYYVPNTVLSLDIRKYIKNQQRVLVTLRKRKITRTYSEIAYVAKKVEWDQFEFPEKYMYLKQILQLPKENKIDMN